MEKIIHNNNKSVANLMLLNVKNTQKLLTKPENVSLILMENEKGRFSYFSRSKKKLK